GELLLAPSAAVASRCSGDLRLCAGGRSSPAALRGGVHERRSTCRGRGSTALVAAVDSSRASPTCPGHGGERARTAEREAVSAHKQPDGHLPGRRLGLHACQRPRADSPRRGRDRDAQLPPPPSPLLTALPP